MLTFRVPNSLLLQWSRNRGDKSYISLLNYSITQQVLHIREECARIEERLRLAVRKLLSKLKHCCSGQKRQYFVGGECHIFVLEGETTHLDEILDEGDQNY